MADLLPVFLTLAGRRVVVVGGGPVAASKLQALLAAAADVTVDGIAPTVSLLDRLVGEIPTATPSFSWVATDDLTPPEALTGVVDIYEIQENRSADLWKTEEIGAGETSKGLVLEPGHEYRAVLRIRDEAGNVSSHSMLFVVSADAADPTTGCGCSGIPTAART